MFECSNALCSPHLPRRPLFLTPFVLSAPLCSPLCARPRCADHSGGSRGREQVRDHFRKLAEKFTEKSFFNTWYADSRASSRMSPDDFNSSMDWLNSHFVLIRHEDEARRKPYLRNP